MPEQRVRATRRRDPEEAQAMCQNCGWTSHCTRERARLHVLIKGHSVDYVVPDVTVYSPLENVDA
jgi:hypothetical protein